MGFFSNYSMKIHFDAQQMLKTEILNSCPWQENALKLGSCVHTVCNVTFGECQLINSANWVILRWMDEAIMWLDACHRAKNGATRCQEPWTEWAGWRWTMVLLPKPSHTIRMPTRNHHSNRMCWIDSPCVANGIQLRVWWYGWTSLVFINSQFCCPFLFGKICLGIVTVIRSVQFNRSMAQ